MLEQEAVALADVLFAQANTPGPKAVNKSGKVAIIVIMMLTVTTVVAIVATVIGYLAYKRKRLASLLLR